MAGVLNQKTGLLTDAPQGTTINDTGVVNRPITSSPVSVLPGPDRNSLISSTPQAGYIQGYDTNNNYSPVYVPKGQYVPGISATPNQITTDSLKTGSNVKLPGVTDTNTSDASSLVAGASQNIASLVEQLTPPETDANKKQQSILDQIAGLTGEQGNLGTDQLAAEEQAGIPQLRTQLASINGDIQTKLAEYKVLETENQNKPITMNSIIGNERAILNAKASDIGLLQARANALSGNIEAAQQNVDRAVGLKYQTIEARLNTYQAQLNALLPTLNKEEKVQALAQQTLLDKQKQEIADKKEKEKSIQNAMMAYFNAGGTDTKVANAISNATTVEEAQRLAGAQVAKTVQEDRLLDTQYKRAQIANIQSEINNRGASAQGYDPTEILAYAQQFASNGKIPTGLPKGSFGLVSQIAKELPKPEGTLVNRNTGVAAELSASEQEGLVALYDIQKRLPGLRADFDKMIPGLVSGTIGNLFPSKTKQNYLTQRDEILSLLLKARSGAAVSEQEFERYKKLLPSTFNKALFLGGSGVNKIDNFQKSINSSLTSRLDTTGNAIYGYSEVKIGDQSYKVGDIINNGEQSARVNPDGTLTIIQ